MLSRLDRCASPINLLGVTGSSTAPPSFAEIGRIPASGDNVAIAIRTLEAGSRFVLRQLVFETTHTILEGHRFAIFRIRKGEPLLSWGLPFGLAMRDIEPGEYVCNEKILRVLRERHVSFPLPAAPNFVDHRLEFVLDEARFRPGRQVLAPGPAPTFAGYRRNERRGFGTRNYIVVLGVNSRAGAFSRLAAQRFLEVRKTFPNIDGVVAVEHTEGGTASRPNNFELTLRSLAGFAVNPNVGAILCVDFGGEMLSNAALERYLAEHDYPTQGLVHEFLSIGTSFETALVRAHRIIEGWTAPVNDCPREETSIRHLRLGLQCGGSDAFSGVSANPLLGILSRETVAHGGSANLAETDELIGAESCVLQNVRDLETARAFLRRTARFQEWAARHGHSAEGNPSGGNLYRGLYNISIKSIGAARKKDPATRLDYVIDYGERMTQPGFYFMDSPGNDLESIAGQVAAGCNMILFATGNGSITNFPFVPTIKVMTTTRRFELVREEMDFNAGRYQDGEDLEALGREAFEQMRRIASGERSAGERAGHSQVQLWREWRLNERHEARTGEQSPHAANPPPDLGGCRIEVPFDELSATPGERCLLILPTSLCAGQVALKIAQQLNESPERSRERAVALAHTEGCGNSGGESERLFLRTMAGYLAHPLVSRALLLEHGCEKTHNDAFRNILRELQLPADHYGFASIQLDGGIERVTARARAWLESAPGHPSHGAFCMALAGRDLAANLRQAFAALAEFLVAHHCAAVLPAGTAALHRPGLIKYGERITVPGVYEMECPTDDLVEMNTGLAATGAQILVVFEPAMLLPGHSLVPTVQIAKAGSPFETEADLVIDETGAPEEIAKAVLALAAKIRRNEYLPKSARIGNTAFQITRGYEGISL